MVKVMEHHGLRVYIDSKDKDYIRVMGRWKNRESLAVFEMEWGQLSKIRIYHREGKRLALPPKLLLEFEDILSMYASDFINLWARLHSKTYADIERYTTTGDSILGRGYTSH